MNAQLPPLPESKKLTYYTGNTPFCYFSADQMHAYAIAALTAPKEAEPAWLTSLRNELPLTPMKSGFTLTRDELQYLVDRLAAPSKEATPSPQDRAPGEGEIAHIAYDFLLAAGYDMDSAPLTKIKEAALSSPTGEGAVEGDDPIDANDNADYIEHCADKLVRLGYRITGQTLKVVAAEHRALTASPQVQGGEASPGEPAPPPSTPAQHWLAAHNGVASQEWQDGFNACAEATPQGAPGADAATASDVLDRYLANAPSGDHWPPERQRDLRVIAMRDAINNAMQAALTSGPSGVDGWQLVPAEPTYAMRAAGRAAHYEAETRAISEWYAGKAGMSWRENRASHVYSAMLAAAPTPQGQGEGNV
jgi:hypothetical protein